MTKVNVSAQLNTVAVRGRNNEYSLLDASLPTMAVTCNAAIETKCFNGRPGTVRRSVQKLCMFFVLPLTTRACTACSDYTSAYVQRVRASTIALVEM